MKVAHYHTYGYCFNFLQDTTQKDVADFFHPLMGRWEAVPGRDVFRVSKSMGLAKVSGHSIYQRPATFERCAACCSINWDVLR